MSKFFINHPIPALVLSIILTIAGALTATRLPVAEYPNIAPPTVSVSTSYIGADASVVNNTVAQIIEEAVNGVGDIEYMSSTIDTNGGYDLSIVFALGTDIDIAAVRVQNKLSSVMSDLPAEVQAHGVNVTKNMPDSVLMVDLFSPNGSYDGVFLKNYVTVYFLDKIRRVNGVGSVDFFGGDYSMRIWINPDKLADLGLTIADVEAAIKEQNVQAAVGSLGKMPTGNLQEREFVGHSTNRKETPADFENIVVKTADGSFVRVKDFARVEIGSRDINSLAFHDGKESAIFSVLLTNDANILETVSAVKEILEEARKDFPPDMEYSISLDATRFINESLTEVMKTFFEALLLVVIVVWLFLKSFRATLIALLAIPVSIVATFAIFPLAGFTINTLTLFALILAIGLVVDDAIVVIEVVEKKLEQGLEVKAATLEAMQEIQAPIIAIACVLAAVFLPAAFLEGITGELYRQFALTIVVAMIFSTFVALTLTPALCVMILKGNGKREMGKVFSLPLFPSPISLFPLTILIAVTAGASQISRYNGMRCVSFDGNVSEGYSTGQALDALEEVVEEVAPNTFQIEWAEQSRQERLAKSSVNEILVLALVFAFLCLVALYESWKIPFAVMLSVPTAIFGALLAEVVTGNLASVYMQIGILVLIGLAAKNAILIVEVAKVKVKRGEEPARAAVDAAKERFRPILMTSLAFIVACIPLAMATGAGSAARNGMGAAVVGGMISATVLGIFIVPALFALIMGRRKND